MKMGSNNISEDTGEKMETVYHNIAPVYDKNSRILILGSFPSVKSREAAFFYHHPQNRFWKVLAAVVGKETPCTVEEKRACLLAHHIAVWDVIASCTIHGSSDASIRDAKPNDLSKILDTASIQKICTNGGTSWKLYRKYQMPLTGLEPVRLPSTSPANAAWSLERLVEAWGKEIGAAAMMR